MMTRKAIHAFVLLSIGSKLLSCYDFIKWGWWSVGWFTTPVALVHTFIGVHRLAVSSSLHCPAVALVPEPGIDPERQAVATRCGFGLGLHWDPVPWVSYAVRYVA